eukprot:Partr_v1_DN25004_c1_g1_i1_m51069 putative chitin binding
MLHRLFFLFSIAVLVVSVRGQDYGDTEPGYPLYHDHKGPRRCGRDFNNLQCNTAFGHCCSIHGWCGVTEDHCGVGCQNGSCLTGPSVSGAAAQKKFEEIDAGNDNFGDTEPGFPQFHGHTGPRRCGRDFNNLQCNTDFGLCCSKWGWCGATAEHCGVGCQNGKCLTTGSVGGTSDAGDYSNGGDVAGTSDEGDCTNGDVAGTS